jgi:hypothetical protein
MKGTCHLNVGEFVHGDGAAGEQCTESLRKSTADGGYTDKQVYSCDETALYCKPLSTKSSDLQKLLRKACRKTNKK